MVRLKLPKSGLITALCGVAVLAGLSFALAGKKKSERDRERVLQLCSDISGKWTAEEKDKRYTVIVDLMGNIHIRINEGGYEQEVRYVSENRDKIVIATLYVSYESVDEYALKLGKDTVALSSPEKTIVWKRPAKGAVDAASSSGVPGPKLPTDEAKGTGPAVARPGRRKG
jgi:hypothetical protein